MVGRQHKAATSFQCGQGFFAGLKELKPDVPRYPQVAGQSCKRRLAALPRDEDADLGQLSCDNGGGTDQFIQALLYVATPQVDEIRQKLTRRWRGGPLTVLNPERQTKNSALVSVIEPDVLVNSL